MVQTAERYAGCNSLSRLFRDASSLPNAHYVLARYLALILESPTNTVDMSSTDVSEKIF